MTSIWEVESVWKRRDLGGCTLGGWVAGFYDPDLTFEVLMKAEQSLLFVIANTRVVKSL